MAWVYTLSLTRYVPAGQLAADWRAIASTEIAHHLGGVTVVGRHAVIVTLSKEPAFKQLANQAYVDSITVEKEIPSSRQDASFSPPYELYPGVIELPE